MGVDLPFQLHLYGVEIYLSQKCLFQRSRQVEILHGLTDYSLSDTPDSLLQLKLSDMLRDTGQLMMFRAYLNNIHAPLNELDFLVHAGDAHGRMLNIQVIIFMIYLSCEADNELLQRYCNMKFIRTIFQI